MKDFEVLRTKTKPSQAVTSFGYKKKIFSTLTF